VSISIGSLEALIASFAFKSYTWALLQPVNLQIFWIVAAFATRADRASVALDATSNSVCLEVFVLENIVTVDTTKLCIHQCV
jgi:hypothetical protein